jgi:Tfp pilus assembly PilM family ATPase
MKDDSSGSFGLDITDSAVRVVQLDARNAIVSYGETLLPNGVVKNGRVVNDEVLCSVLRQLPSFVRGEPIAPDAWAFVALSDICTEIREYDFPFWVGKRKLRKAILERFEEEFPFADEEKYLSWEIIGGFVRNRPFSLLAAFSAKTAVDELVLAMKTCGSRIAGMQATSIAVANALVPGGLAGGDPRKSNLANGTIFVNYRRDYASLAFYDSGYVHSVLTIAKSSLSEEEFARHVSERLVLGSEWHERQRGKAIRQVAIVGEAPPALSVMRGLLAGRKLEVIEGDCCVNLNIAASIARPSSAYAAAIGLALKTNL